MEINFRPETYAMSIRQASYDDAKDQYLVDRDLIVYNFDEIKEYICRRFRDNAFVSSCDAFYAAEDGREYLIEFKNQKPEDVPRRSVKQKAFDSLYLLMLSFHPHQTVEEISKRLSLIVVYNEHASKGPRKGSYNKSESFDKMAAKFGGYAKVKTPLSTQFGLGYLKGQLYRNIYTLDVREFVRRFVDCNFVGKAK